MALIFLINLPIGLLVAGGAWALLAGREVDAAQPADGLHRPGAAHRRRGFVADSARQGQRARLVRLDRDRRAGRGVGGGAVLLRGLGAGRGASLVELRLFASRNFLVGVLCLLFGMVSYFGTVVVQPYGCRPISATARCGPAR